jgi:hypothetical protein
VREPVAPAISTHGSLASWSHWDGRTWRLRLRRGDGRAVTAPVPGQKMPFDVDLGPDAHGRTIAVYSRCRRPARSRASYDAPVPNRASAAGCRLYRYDPVARRERRVALDAQSGASYYFPAVSGRRIAFAVSDAGVRAGKRPASLAWASSTGRIRSLPGGTVIGGGGVGPTELDLQGDRLAFEWVQVTAGCSPASSDVRFGFETFHEVWIDEIGGGRRLVDKACVGGSPQLLFSPAWAGRHLLYVGAEDEIGRALIRRYDTARDRYAQTGDDFSAYDVGAWGNGGVMVADVPRDDLRRPTRATLRWARPRWRAVSPSVGDDWFGPPLGPAN